jgi:hypothetical protein
MFNADSSIQKGPVSQRPLNSKHVKQLKARMKHKVRRTELSDRLHVSMTRKEYDACIKYTSEQYTKWFDQKITEVKYSPDELRAALKKLIMSPTPIKDAPILLWDPALKTQPQLDTGQHRRAAFLQAFNAKGEWRELTPETVLVSIYSKMMVEQLFKGLICTSKLVGSLILLTWTRSTINTTF